MYIPDLYDMNIFFLSMSIMRCAKYHFDKHVVKMIIEYCQLLSTAWHILDSELAAKHLDNQLIYRKTHMNHPCAVWCRQHINNYNYVARLGLQLCREWRYRYGHPDTRLHGSEIKLLFLYKNPPPSISILYISKTSHNPKSLSTPLPQAMPDSCRSKKSTVHGSVRAYRRYYKSEHKTRLVSWTVKNNKTRDSLTKPLWW